MTLGLSVYIFLLISQGLVRTCVAHKLPKGFHLSNSCQPRCQSGTTCVVYKGGDGNAQYTCKRIDPQKVVLDGAFIISTKGLNNSSNNPNNNDPSFSYGNNIANFESLIKPLPDIGTETARAKDVAIVNPEGLLDRTNSFSDLEQHNLQTKLGTIEQRLQLFDPSKFGKNIYNFPLFKHLTSTKKRKSNKKRRSRFEDLILTRNPDGSVVFRRIDTFPNLQSSKQLQNMKEIPVRNRIVADSSRIGQSHTRHFTIPRILTKENNTTCTPCDPDQSCPLEQYCFYSPSCARQICQPLN